MSDKGETKGNSVVTWLKDQVFESDGMREAGKSPSATPVVSQPQPSPVPVRRAPSAAIVVDDPQVRQKLDSVLAAFPACSGVRTHYKTLSMIADDQSRIQAVLALVAPQGHTPEAVLKDFDDCLAALDKKERDVQTAATKQITDRVGGREKSVAQLEAQIETLKADVARQKAEIATERDSINATEQRFVATAAVYRDELQQLKQKITNHGTQGA